MSKTFERVLDFNEKPISLVNVDGQWWVAIKPLCEALDIDYQAQHKNLVADETLSQLSSEQTIVAADGKLRKMVCLPEKFIYGWLFSVRSESPVLREYKLKCYEVLFNHFHGILSSRATVLREIGEAHAEIAALKEKLKESPEYQRLTELGGKISALQRHGKILDRDLLTGQLSFLTDDE